MREKERVADRLHGRRQRHEHHRCGHATELGTLLYDERMIRFAALSNTVQIPLEEKRMMVRYRQLRLPGLGKDVMPRPAQLIAAGRTPTWDHSGSTLFLRVS